MSALRNLGRRKVRSALTIAGISIGIVALVVFGSMATKISGFVSANVDYLKGTVNVTQANSTDRVRQPLSPSAIEAVRHVQGVRAVVPVVELMIESGDPMTILPDEIVGSTPEADVVDGAYRVAIAQGRKLQTSDAQSNVAVLGSDIAVRYRKQVGDSFELRGERFIVVGIDETTTAMPDGEIHVPLAAAQRLFVASMPETFRSTLDPAGAVTTLVVYPQAGLDADALATRIRAATPDVKTMTSLDLDEQVGSLSKLFNAILIGVGMLSLLVGSLSVINTMAMAVAERTREIGVKRAIGGSRRRVVREIVVESAFIGFLGGTVGLAVGALIVVAGNEAGRSSGTILFDLTAATAIGAVAFATLLGALAGLVPALNAARLDPVAALRYE